MSTVENDQIIDESNSSEEDDLEKLLLPDVENFPLIPPSAIETNFVTYFALDFTKPAHDQYIYRHANGLYFHILKLHDFNFKLTRVSHFFSL